MSNSEASLTGQQKVERAFANLLVPMSRIADLCADQRRVAVVYAVNERLRKTYASPNLDPANPTNIVLLNLVNEILQGFGPIGPVPVEFALLVRNGETFLEVEQWECRKAWILNEFDESVRLAAGLYYAGGVTDARQLSSIMPHTGIGEARRIINIFRKKRRVFFPVSVSRRWRDNVG